jgi:hypothetical protein
MALMTENRLRHLPVMNGGKLIGLISIGDLVKDIISEQKFVIEQLEHYIHGEGESTKERCRGPGDTRLHRGSYLSPCSSWVRVEIPHPNGGHCFSIGQRKNLGFEKSCRNALSRPTVLVGWEAGARSRAKRNCVRVSV